MWASPVELQAGPHQEGSESRAQPTENEVKYLLVQVVQHLLGNGKWDNFAKVISNIDEGV